MDAVTDQIHAEVDRYVTRTADGKKEDWNRTAVEIGLRQVLQSTSDLPATTFVCNSGEARGLVVAYSLSKGGWMGEGSTSFMLRAYGTQGGQMQLLSSTGSDMDGYSGLSILKLHPRAAEQDWFVVSGYMTGANGPNERMRAYAYRDGKFKTIWMPANAWGEFRLRATELGFILDGEYYKSSQKRHEVYVLAEDGLYLRPEN